MSDATQYTVRDSAGNVYGPATIATLRTWHGQGRIVAGMQIAPQGGADWQNVETFPGLADLFGNAPAIPAAAAAPATPTPAAPAASTTPTPSTPATDAAKAPAGKGLYAAVMADSPMAMWGAIIAAVGVICACGCGALAGIAGAIMGLVAFSNIKPETDPRVRTVAIAAMILGGVSLITNCCGLGILNFVHF